MAQTVAVRVGAVELLVEVMPVAGSQQTSAGGRVDRAVDYAAGAFERAQSAVEEIAVSTARMVGRVTRRVGSPESVEVEFGLKVSAKGDVIVAGASGEASLKVKIIYGASGDRTLRGPGEADPDDVDTDAEEPQDGAS
ncbi:CU044_2847 family protein [Micromonospora sp. NPDC023888]|uniref:CU044_2847 family protein n=1 Tax=Micromonospora sp. NPDC023888 TaxID=3155607 RepID=UPI0033DC2445